MTVNQIREALSFMEANYSSAMDSDDYSFADAIHDKILILRDRLVKAIVAEDPCTTEADVRYFEGF
jgi:hypothetical protein